MDKLENAKVPDTAGRKTRKEEKNTCNCKAF